MGNSLNFIRDKSWKLTSYYPTSVISLHLQVEQVMNHDLRINLTLLRFHLLEEHNGHLARRQKLAYTRTK